MAPGEEAFAHALCRTACLQLIYAQAERRAKAGAGATGSAAPNSKSPTPAKAARGGGAAPPPQPPPPPGAVFVSGHVADALADVIAAFITQLASSTSARARLAGRSSATFLDAISALAAVSPSTQSSLRDIFRYATLQQVDFPAPVPPFPVLPPPSRKRPRDSAPLTPDPPTPERKRVFLDAWMPPLPHAHTFVNTPGVLAPPDRGKVPPPTEQRRRVEMSLARLKHLHGGAATDSALAPVAGRRPVVPENPFLAPPRLAARRADLREEPPRELTEQSGERRAEHDIPAPDARAAVSDQKRARVDRILAESGGTAGAAPNAATPAPNTPAPGTPAPNTPAVATPLPE